MDAPKTPMARQSRSVSSRNGTAIAVKMMMPPIVGVPALAWWPSGPSSRMFWPNSRSRRNVMNFGDRKMQISSEAVPAIRTSPTGQCLRDGFKTDAPRCFDEHDIAGADDLAGDRRGGHRVRGQQRLAAEGLRHRHAQRPDGDQQIHARGRRIGADRAMFLRLARPELEHVPENGHP